MSIRHSNRARYVVNDATADTFVLPSWHRSGRVDTVSIYQTAIGIEADVFVPDVDIHRVLHFYPNLKTRTSSRPYCAPRGKLPAKAYIERSNSYRSVCVRCYTHAAVALVVHYLRAGYP